MTATSKSHFSSAPRKTLAVESDDAQSKQSGGHATERSAMTPIGLTDGSDASDESADDPTPTVVAPIRWSPPSGKRIAEYLVPNRMSVDISCEDFSVKLPWPGRY